MPEDQLERPEDDNPEIITDSSIPVQDSVQLHHTHMQQIIDNIDSDKLTNSEAWSEHQITVLASIILVFTLVSLVLATIVLIKQKATQLYTLRTFAIINILGFATFIVIVGYSVEQINGVLTLFSALIGYLLGKDASASTPTQENTAKMIENENRDYPLND